VTNGCNALTNRLAFLSSSAEAEAALEWRECTMEIGRTSPHPSSTLSGEMDISGF
jgi:hypothetical protein